MCMNGLLRLGSQALALGRRRGWSRLVNDAGRTVNAGRREVCDVTGTAIQGGEQLPSGLLESVAYSQYRDGTQHPRSSYGRTRTRVREDIEA